MVKDNFTMCKKSLLAEGEAIIASSTSRSLQQAPNRKRLAPGSASNTDEP